MDRRLFLASLGASAILALSPAGAAGPRSQGDVSLFEEFITNITSLLRAASRPGDFHNRTNVLRFLRNIYSPLNSMQVAKIQIQQDLERSVVTPCATLPQSTRDAVAQLEIDRGTLRALLDRLARAVRPIDMEVPMAQLSERMAYLYADKSWVPQVSQYCRMAATERRQLLRDVRASRLALGRVYESLNALVAKLNIGAV
jgi:hypothetical protein